MATTDPLFDTFPVPPSLRVRLAQQGPDALFPRTMQVSPTTGLIVVDGRGRSVILDGDAAYEQWVSLTVRCHRDAHPLLPRWYGVHRALILAQETPDEQRSTFERECRATLTADARTGAVSFAWDEQVGRLQRCNVTSTSVRGLLARASVEVPIG